LQDIGITTGSVGSQPGTTNSLTLDSTKLAAAIAANPGHVAALFNGTSATNGFQGAAQQLNSYLDQVANPVTGAFALEQSTTSTQIKNFNSQIAQLQLNLTEQRALLTSQFSAMETALVALSTQNGALSALGGLSGSSSSNSSSSSSSGSSSGG
jgi:flagellar hook-associated protein 2